MFKISYGTEKGKYDKIEQTNTNKFTINNIDVAKTYFVKITPIDSN
jgi:hypothetical protein